MILYILCIRAVILFVSFAVTYTSFAKRIKRDNSWAIITGCTQGIGLSYAKQLYKLGYNILLVSRDKQKLLITKKQIRDKDSCQQRIEILDIDFCDNKDANYQRIREAFDRLDDITVVVNNVGIIYPNSKPERLTRLTTVDQLINDLINVNMLSHVKCTSLSLPSMANNCGTLMVFVSSLGSLFASPLFTLYSSSKVFIDYFSRGIRLECKAKGVSVQSLIPGYVSTQMSRFMRPRFDAPKPDVYVMNAIDVNEDRDRSTGFWSHQLFYNLFQLITFISLTINIDLLRIMAIKRSIKIKKLIEKIMQLKQNK